MKKNDSCAMYYKVLKGLFPKLSFTEGKFLKDVKIQLRDFGTIHPNATYDDVIDAFGPPEQIVAEFLNNQNSAQLHSQVLLYRNRKTILHGILVTLAIMVLGTYILFFTCYQSFLKYNSTISETTVEPGIRSE